jgi:hypothetical protein
LYWKIVKSSTWAEFDDLMNRLKTKHPNAYAYLNVIPPHQWSNFAQPKSSWGQMCNNMAERGVKAMGTDKDMSRKLNACEIIVRYVDMQQRRFDKARERIAKWITADPLCPRARETFANEYESAQDYEVLAAKTSISSEGVECKTYDLRFNIDVRSRPVGYDGARSLSEDRQSVHAIGGDRKLTCTCASSRYQGIPCRHICAVQQNLENVKTFLVDVPTLVHECMLKANVQRAYGVPLRSTFASSNAWTHSGMQGPAPKEISSTLLGKRIRSKSAKHTGVKSGRRLRRCSLCRSFDHTAARCTLSGLSAEDRRMAVDDGHIHVNHANIDTIVADDAGGPAPLETRRP